MRNLKLAFLSIIFIACCFTSCTNNEPVIEEQNIGASTSITTSLTQLRTQFDSQGDVIPTENPTGNIVFDFCFDFVYPLNLSYNNGTTVTIINLDDLVEVMIYSSDDLYINGIEFPFDVEVYNEDQDAIVVATINNEEEFADLLEDCDFEDNCNCNFDYSPVCIELNTSNGESFIITYPNACAAECDGFTQADFVENCYGDYNSPGGTDCFTFNFPITIITDNGATITVNSQTELDNALYNAYYFNFVYSFDVTLDDGTVLTVGNEEAFIALLESCLENSDCTLDIESLQFILMSCDVYDIEIYNQNEEIVDINQVMFNDGGELIVNGELTVTDIGTWSVTTVNNTTTIIMDGALSFPLLNGSWELIDCFSGDLEFSNGNYTIKLECQDCICTTEVNPVCVEVETGLGTEIITFLNSCEAECAGYSANDFVDCQSNTANCSEEELDTILNDCVWYVNTSLYQNVIPEYFIFNTDGSFSVGNPETNETVTVGDWSTNQNPSTNQISMSFGTDMEPYTLIAALDWTVVVCSEEFILLESNNEFLQLERDCN
ncbi:hypothetical protein [Psychroserpens luteus]|uniref:Kazal-like domain-containing protein n=1 Tax=Psychroserpens luteus TaxID=1434066 RepID=A0ABW5ZSL5_9FLAO|nr:hypothetical protein [Psychroserpens luteus]